MRNLTVNRLEPAPRTEPQILRDKIYAELRSIGEQTERLTKRLAHCSAWIATLPLPDDRRRDEGE
jgi:hypothetical protein